MIISSIATAIILGGNLLIGSFCLNSVISLAYSIPFSVILSSSVELGLYYFISRKKPKEQQTIINYTEEQKTAVDLLKDLQKTIKAGTPLSTKEAQELVYYILLTKKIEKEAICCYRKIKDYSKFSEKNLYDVSIPLTRNFLKNILSYDSLIEEKNHCIEKCKNELANLEKNLTEEKLELDTIIQQLKENNNNKAKLTEEIAKKKLPNENVLNNNLENYLNDLNTQQNKLNEITASIKILQEKRLICLKNIIEMLGIQKGEKIPQNSDIIINKLQEQLSQKQKNSKKGETSLKEIFKKILTNSQANELEELIQKYKNTGEKANELKKNINTQINTKTNLPKEIEKLNIDIDTTKKNIALFASLRQIEKKILDLTNQNTDLRTKVQKIIESTQQEKNTIRTSEEFLSKEKNFKKLIEGESITEDILKTISNQNELKALLEKVLDKTKEATLKKEIDRIYETSGFSKDFNKDRSKKFIIAAIQAKEEKPNFIDKEFTVEDYTKKIIKSFLPIKVEYVNEKQKNLLETLQKTLEKDFSDKIFNLTEQNINFLKTILDEKTKHLIENKINELSKKKLGQNNTDGENLMKRSDTFFNTIINYTIDFPIKDQPLVFEELINE